MRKINNYGPQGLLFFVTMIMYLIKYRMRNKIGVKLFLRKRKLHYFSYLLVTQLL